MIKLLSIKLVENAFYVRAHANILYHALLLRCDIVIHPETDKLYVKMPTIIQKKRNRMNVVTWPCNADSDEFQKTVLEQLKAEYPKAFEYPPLAVRKAANDAKKQKARPVSKFQKPNFTR